MVENQKIQKWYLHVDLDAFFASVEQLDFPEYRGKPVIVGGKPEDRRGVVSTASYEARKFGVHSAMPTFQAYKLCPNGIFVHGRMERYAEISYQIMNILKNYSPDVEQMSIDEAFLDITGTEKLFGKPEETALKIKDQIKNETGLTISVGLAPTKYLAKLASDYKKPDGFYWIKPGEEVDFMLSLPIKKVWGIGTKTEETLKKSGIKTTKDIYEKDLDLLSFMFGNNTANFLYNAVRGKELESFGKEVKMHSISAETTFPYDIFDTYVLETKILDLAHGVYFRLLKQNSFSRTAFLKIRYEDFSTFTIQETEETNICTLDSFFEILKRLFEKKYEKGRGIRLLGVGFENVEKEEKPYQQSLFENSDKKKQKIEKAILNLQKKHPEIEIKKARTLKSIGILFAAALISFLNPQLITAQTISKADAKNSAAFNTETLEEPAENKSNYVFDVDINDKNKVNFDFSGYWKQEISSGFNFSFNKGFSSDFQIPVFKQEVDLTALITLNDLWFFESIFADEFENNTFTIGYKKDNNLIKISNRNITFPQEYSASYFGYGLSGGKNEAPGFSAHLESDETKIKQDYLIRYEMTENHNATFIGYNQVTDYSFEISDFCYGKFFIFPEDFFENNQTIKNIYLEDSKGDFKDKYSRKFKKLDSTEYQILKNTNQLVLADSVKSGKNNNKIPAILITFENKSVENLLSKCGSYNNKDSFLGKIQNTFGENFNLEKYSYDLENEIENEKAICIQNNTGFSPFLVSNIYDLGIINDADVIIQSKTTKLQNNTFSSELIDNNFSENLFNTKHLYTQVFLEDRFPFAKINPEIYLNLETNTDFEIIARTYNQVSDFTIGTNAIAGTVQVKINGININDFTFNSETGTVNLKNNVSLTDKIYISWQEESSSYNTGAFAFGAGLFYDFSENLKSDISLTTRWPVSYYASYSTPSNELLGFTALSGGISYSKGNFNIKDKASISLENSNASGNLVVYEETEKNETYYLSSSSGFETLVEPVLNLHSNNIELKNSECGTVKSFSGIKDSVISGFAIPLEWDFSSISTDSAWASVDIKLDLEKNLSNSSSVELALKPLLNNSEINNYKIYIQLGVNADSTFNGEDTYNVPTWLISEANDYCESYLDLSKKEWQTVKINLSSQDKIKLTSNKDLRIIVVKDGNITKNDNGIIFAGPYCPLQQSADFTVSDEILVNINNTESNSPSTKNLKIEDNNSIDISWIIPEVSKIDSENSKITVEKYFDLSDFSKYKTINLDFAFNGNKVENSNSCENPFFTLILDSPDYQNPDLSKEALNLCVYNLEKYNNSDLTYHTLSVDLTSKKVFIDNEELGKEDFTLLISEKIIPSREKIEISTFTNNFIYSKAHFYLDNLYYSSSIARIKGQNYTYFEYSKKEPIVSVNNFELLKNPEIKINSNQGLYNSTLNSSVSGFINSDAKAEITFCNILNQLQIDTSFNSDQTNFINSAGHLIKTDKSILQILNFEEDYNFNKSDKTLSKRNALSADFSSYKVPVKIYFDSTSQLSKYLSKQNANIGLNFNIPFSNWNILFTSKLNANQKENSLFNNSNYFTDYKTASLFNFSTGKENANVRNISLNNNFALSVPFGNLKPELNFLMESNYKNAHATNINDSTELKFNLPFSIKNNSFDFSIKRSTEEKQIFVYGGNYITDASNYFTNLSNVSYIFTAIPFYELFDKNLNSKIYSPSNFESNKYSTIYDLTWKRKLFNKSIDILLPSSTEILASRNLDSSLTINDYYQLKTIITNSCINIFGSNSKLKWFDFYKNDEFITSLTGILKLPANNFKNYTYTISAYNQSVFYIDDNNFIKEGLNYCIDTDKNWDFSSSSIWNHKAETSPIAFVINLCSKNNIQNLKIKEKESLNLSFSNNNSIFKQTYGFSHKDEVSFLKFYTIGCEANVSYTLTKNAADNLGVNLTLSGKMEF